MSLQAILVGDTAVSSQQSNYESLKSSLSSKGIEVSFEPSSLTSVVKGNGFVIADGSRVLVSASNISTKHNWIEVFGTFADNYKNSEMIDGSYAWGQIVPTSGEYLCKDCGYIAEFEAGDVFPVCEVCQAGEPDGPCLPNEGYWEPL
jgi:hypothetical protein